MIRVTAVQPGSIGADLGLQPGTELLSVDGRDLHDFLDWEFLTAEEQFDLHVRHPSGEEIEFDIERPINVPMGVSLEPPRVRRCANRCDFCFVDGLPEGLREGLYIRDDDYRLSFRYGHFVTMTNLKRWDIDRIIEYRLSPLYVSVHATDPIIRRYVLRNPLAPDILPLLTELASHGIRFHTQIVMSPGVNDGDVMEATLGDLYALGAPVLSCSVVPVGLTEFSKHHLVREPTAAECAAAIDRLERWAARATAERGEAWAIGADELYNRAGRALPPASVYGGFEQAENGVGAVRLLQSVVAENQAAFTPWRGCRIAVVTGTAMGALMPEVLQPLAAASQAHFELVVVANSLFGPSVTCSGLLPGVAIQRALSDLRDMDFALIPGESLNDGGLFMDDMSLATLQAAVPMAVLPSRHFSDAVEARVA